VRANPVKRTLAEGGVAIGTLVFEFDTTGIGRIAAAAGADFVLFDLEHTGWTVETLRRLVATTRATELVPLTRVPATHYHLIAPALDVGAMGVMAPMVESQEQARLLVASAKYPPLGRRGAAFGVAHDDYLPGDVAEKIRSTNAETMLIALVETAAGIDQVDRIAAVDGIDVVWIGHFDLTNSLGIPARFDHPTYLAAVEQVLAACRRHGKAAGFMVADAEDGRAKLAQGFRCLGYSGDLWIYQQALREGIAALRAHVTS
jgi:2-keto-3-deoxy-L-rhamnonate aldolase RhmA